MPVDGYYTPKEAQQATGASSSALRNYTRDYARWLSTEATSVPRRFTEADLKLIAFVVDCTKMQGLTHSRVVERLNAGELDAFAWSMPTMHSTTPTGGTGATETTEDATYSLVPLERLQVAQALLDDAKQRELAAIEEKRLLQSRLEEVQIELGRAQGELSALRAMLRRPPRWWVRLFGGRAGDA